MVIDVIQLGIVQSLLDIQSIKDDVHVHFLPALGGLMLCVLNNSWYPHFVSSVYPFERLSGRNNHLVLPPILDRICLKPLNILFYSVEHGHCVGVYEV